MIQLKDVLHYYIGQQMEYNGLRYNLEGINISHEEVYVNDGTYFGIDMSISECSLVLRPISSLTDDEKVKWYTVYSNGTVPAASERSWAIGVINGKLQQYAQNGQLSIREFHYLLSIGCDLFSLIDTHQAIVHIDK